VHNQKDVKKCATCTYAGKYVDRSAKLFQKQDLGAAFKTRNIRRTLNNNEDKNKRPNYANSVKTAPLFTTDRQVGNSK